MRAEPDAVFTSVDEAEHRVVVVACAVQFAHVILQTARVWLSSQEVRVTGTLADTVLPGLLVLVNVTEVKAHGSGPKVQPSPVATGEVNGSTEGSLVRVTGTIT